MSSVRTAPPGDVSQGAAVGFAGGRSVAVWSRAHAPVSEDRMADGVAKVDAGARPGQTQTIRFTIDAPGTYRITCTVPGHADAGMTGTLVVDSAD